MAARAFSPFIPKVPHLNVHFDEQPGTVQFKQTHLIHERTMSSVIPPGTDSSGRRLDMLPDRSKLIDKHEVLALGRRAHPMLGSFEPVDTELGLREMQHRRKQVEDRQKFIAFNNGHTGSNHLGRIDDNPVVYWQQHPNRLSNRVHTHITPHKTNIVDVVTNGRPRSNKDNSILKNPVMLIAGGLLLLMLLKR